MLELFDERLTRFEKSLDGRKTDCQFGAYSEAMGFLDAIYLFSRILLDSAAGVVRFFQKQNNNGHEFPKSFDDIYKKSVKGLLPDGLNTVFSGCETWFPQLKDRRDAIVHHYETCYIVFDRDSAGRRAAQQFSPRKTTHESGQDLRSYIGMVMAGYQRFVDRLLDYWDDMFWRWYHICIPRSTCILEGRAAAILWWGHRYGEYTNDNMIVTEP